MIPHSFFHKKYISFKKTYSPSTSVTNFDYDGTFFGSQNKDKYMKYLPTGEIYNLSRYILPMHSLKVL